MIDFESKLTAILFSSDNRLNLSVIFQAEGTAEYGVGYIGTNVGVKIVHSYSNQCVVRAFAN